VQEASPEGWQEISPGWSASDTRGFSFNANRTPEGCEDNLDSVKPAVAVTLSSRLLLQPRNSNPQTQITPESMFTSARRLQKWTDTSGPFD